MVKVTRAQQFAKRQAEHMDHKKYEKKRTKIVWRDTLWKTKLTK